jgi:hypothetical protein
MTVRYGHRFGRHGWVSMPIWLLPFWGTLMLAVWVIVVSIWLFFVLPYKLIVWGLNQLSETQTTRKRRGQ